MKHIINNIIRFSWLFGFLFIPNMSFSDTKTFSFTGGVQTWIVPKGNKTITIEGYGAGGGYGENNGNNIGTPGKGGYLKSKNYSYSWRNIIHIRWKKRLRWKRL